MNIEEVGKRYSKYYLYNSKQPEYDYVLGGILNKNMSHIITSSNTPVLKWFLSIIDKSLVYIINYINRLKNFKNYININR